MDYKNNIPAWAYGDKNVKKAQVDEFGDVDGREPVQEQPAGPMMRYSFPFHITVDVPYNSDPEQEKAAVNAALDQVMQQLEGLYGDYVSDRPDVATRSMRGSLDSQDISLY